MTTIPTDVERHYRFLALYWLNKSSGNAMNSFRDCLRPIYGASDREVPHHIGSGLLLKIVERHFLLTSAHVLDMKKGTAPFLGAAGFLPPQGKPSFCTVAPDGNRDRDHLDFAAIMLDENDLREVDPAWFLTEEDVALNPDDEEGHAYTCIGYKRLLEALGGSPCQLRECPEAHGQSRAHLP